MSMIKALNDRLSFIKLSEPLRTRLRGAKPIVMAALPEALDASYTQIRKTPEAAKFFASEEMMRHAKEKQRAHWDGITDGRLDEAYGRAVTFIGEVHARIGLEPRWYIGGYNIVLEHLLTALLEARWPKARFGAAQNQMRQQAIEEAVAVTKTTLLDMEMAITVYLEVSDRARLAAETKARENAAAVVRTMSQAMEAMAAGDLTHRIGNTMPGEYDRLRDDFNAALDKLASTLSSIQNSSRTINGNIEELSQAADNMAQRTEQQSASLLESTTALNVLTEGLRKMAGGAAEANKMVSHVNAGAANSRNVVAEAAKAMGQIENSSREIGQIIGLIDDIAFQTNLLALNAGVEAARAGDAGRGFAVVASEVRALAQRSAEAAKAIKELISTSSSQVNQGVDLVRKTSDTLDGIMSGVGQIDGVISDIANTAANQSGGLSEVNEALGQMSNAVQQSTAMVEETTAAVHSLRVEIDGLNASLAAFRLGSNASAPPSLNRLPTPARRRVNAQAASRV